MTRTPWPLLVALVLVAWPASRAQAVELMRWERLPLTVPLVVGQERVVFIDRNMRVGVPPMLGTQLRVQSAAGAIYLRASEPIPPTRLQLQDVESGALVLIDIVAEPARPGQPALEPVRIVEAGGVPGAAREPGTSATDGDIADGVPRKRARATPVPVVLTRHAAQNLFAPLRTVEAVPGISRVSLRADLPLGTLLPTLPVQAQTLAAWRLEDHVVTAVRLVNMSAGRLTLDPRALQGDFVAATFQHADLGPAGRFTDTTVVYIVTRGRGLAASLLPAVAPFDPASNLPPAAAAGQARGADHEE